MPVLLTPPAVLQEDRQYASGAVFSLHERVRDVSRNVRLAAVRLQRVDGVHAARAEVILDGHHNRARMRVERFGSHSCRHGFVGADPRPPGFGRVSALRMKKQIDQEGAHAAPLRTGAAGAPLQIRTTHGVLEQIPSTIAAA